jgi:hypothetical protein
VAFSSLLPTVPVLSWKTASSPEPSTRPFTKKRNIPCQEKECWTPASGILFVWESAAGRPGFFIWGLYPWLMMKAGCLGHPAGWLPGFSLMMMMSQLPKWPAGWKSCRHQTRKTLSCGSIPWDKKSLFNIQSGQIIKGHPGPVPVKSQPVHRTRCPAPTSCRQNFMMLFRGRSQGQTPCRPWKWWCHETLKTFVSLYLFFYPF